MSRKRRCLQMAVTAYIAHAHREGKPATVVAHGWSQCPRITTYRFAQELCVNECKEELRRATEPSKAHRLFANVIE